jgi:hypothetical protein
VVSSDVARQCAAHLELGVVAEALHVAVIDAVKARETACARARAVPVPHVWQTHRNNKRQSEAAVETNRLEIGALILGSRSDLDSTP